MSSTSQTVVLCGDSIVMSSIGASCRRAGLKVVPFGTQEGDPGEQLRHLSPDVILYDLAHPPADFVLESLTQDPKRLLIGVDLDRDAMLVLSGQHERAVTTTDLVRVITTWRDAPRPLTLWQAHFRRLSQLVTPAVAAFGTRPRRQKLAFAFATMTVCAVLALLLPPGSRQSNVPLSGTAVATLAPEVGLAFAGGILLGALFLALVLRWQHHQSSKQN